MSGKEIFRDERSTPPHTLVHGSLLTQARAGIDADFRRGVNLSASFNLRAELDASYRDGLVAALEAGGRADIGLAFQAMLPIDLFEEAGLVARIQARAAASAYISAVAGLELETVIERVKSRLGGGPITDLAALLIGEMDVRAGFWARAAVSAEIHGRASLTGSLRETERQGAGFSFVFEGGVGLGVGVGIDMIVDMNIPSPYHLVVQLSDVIADRVTEEVAKLIAALGPEDAWTVARGSRLLTVLIRTLTQTAFKLGLALTTERPAEDGVRAITSIAAEQFQRALLQSALDLAGSYLYGWFGDPDFTDELVALESLERDAVVAALQSLRDRATTLTQQPTGSKAWLAALGGLADNCESILAVLPIDERLRRELRLALGMLAAAASLLARLGRPMAGEQDPLTKPADPTATGILGRLGFTASTLGDLATFLVDQDLLGELVRQVPALGGVSRLLADIWGEASTQAVLRALFDALEQPDPDLRILARRLGPAVERALVEQILPDLISPLRQRAPGNVQRYVDEVVLPLVATIPVHVIPHVADLSLAEGARPLREVISAALLQMLSDTLITTIDVIMEHAYAQGALVLDTLADEVRNASLEHPFVTTLVSQALPAWLPIRPTAEDAARMLELAAGTVRLLGEEERRRTLIELTMYLIDFGMADAATRPETTQLLLRTDNPVDPPRLEALLFHVGRDMLDLVALVVPGALEIVGTHFWHMVRGLEQLFSAAAMAGVRLFRQTVDVMIWTAEAIYQQIKALTQAAEMALARIANAVAIFAGRLQSLARVVVDHVRDLGWQLLVPRLQGLPRPLIDGIRSVYDVLFNALKWALAAPIGALARLARWLSLELTRHMQGGHPQPDLLQRALRERVLATEALDMRFDIKVSAGPLQVDLGRVVIPVSGILGIVADVAVDYGGLRTTVESCAADVAELHDAEAQRASLEASLGDPNIVFEAGQLRDNLLTRQQLQIEVISPQPYSANQDQVQFNILIHGANRSFVTARFELPRRVSVRLNGWEFVYDEEQWTDYGPDGPIHLSFTLAAERPTPVAGVLLAGQPARDIGPPVNHKFYDQPGNIQGFASAAVSVRPPGDERDNVDLWRGTGQPREVVLEHLLHPEPWLGTLLELPDEMMNDLELKPAAVPPGAEPPGGRLLDDVIYPQLSALNIIGTRKPLVPGSLDLATALNFDPGALQSQLLNELTPRLVPGLNALQVVVSDGIDLAISHAVVFYVIFQE